MFDRMHTLHACMFLDFSVNCEQNWTFLFVLHGAPEASSGLTKMTTKTDDGFEFPDP